MNPADTLQMAKDAGLVLPSPAWIVGCLLFSLLGLAAWRLGKSRALPRVRWLGGALMVYSYATSATWLLWAVGAALCGAVWWCWRRGE